ncbi:class I SAM-dependent methyltransferase [Pectinatus frisingensis]|uniref:class I SAM-dependent methyltransferase n=1 Tax=Pectinatus frisingensis TaxID=865 RepID=UPI003D809914
MNCKICGRVTNDLEKAVILNKYSINYYKCQYCGFIQTERPYWLDEAYSKAITKSDIGLLSRNVYFSSVVSAILKICFPKMDRYIDYGGGYGVFVRLMRDAGFNFFWYDKYCDNLFADAFNANIEKKYDLLTAFEVFEHLENPTLELTKMLKMAPNIIFSTETLPNDEIKPNEWWYFCLDHGQHIAFYDKKTLNFLAEKHQKYYTALGNIHIFTEKPINKIKAKMAKKLHIVINKVIKNKSLLMVDYKSITGKDI